MAGPVLRDGGGDAILGDPAGFPVCLQPTAQFICQPMGLQPQQEAMHCRDFFRAGIIQPLVQQGKQFLWISGNGGGEAVHAAKIATAGIDPQPPPISCPSPRQACFFIKVSGHFEDSGIQEAINGLGSASASAKILGSYPAPSWVEER